MSNYDVAIIGGGTAGAFTAYELSKLHPELNIVMLEQGNPIESRKCPIIQKKTTSCINCKNCSIMNGFGGAGAFSDGKFNFTTAFGGWLHDYIPAEEVMELIEYVDSVNMNFGATEERFSTYTPEAKALAKKALEHDLHLLGAQVKHLGTERNLKILGLMSDYLKERIDLKCNTTVESIEHFADDSYALSIEGTHEKINCKYLVVAPGRSGAEWFSGQCKELGINLINNQVDIGVRVELPASVFEHITDVVYEAKMVYVTKQYGDAVRTFCMNPYGHVVTENVEGCITVNGHSYEDPTKQTENTNFALLVSKHFSEPFKDSNGYGESIARLSNMLGGGVMVQRFGDLVRGRRSTVKRVEEGIVRPTLSATPGDLSLVLPKRILDGIIEMIYALDKIAPGTANDDTLLYGVEVKFYNMEVQLDEHLESIHKGLYIIGDGSGVTHSLSHASASGVFVAREILKS